VISRLEQMVGMAGIPVSISSIRAQIVSAIRIIVQLQRFTDGRRRITKISEIVGLEGDTVLMQDIFKFVRIPTTDGSVSGHFEATGIRPRFLADLAAEGISVPDSCFDPQHRQADASPALRTRSH
jgi:pilus assembly protein CpaF